MTDHNEQQGKRVAEELEMAGNELIDRVKELIAEGNVRRLIIRKEDGEILMELPLTPSVVAGGAVLAMGGWMLAALGAVAAFLTRVRVEVVRTNEPLARDEKTHIELD